MPLYNPTSFSGTFETVNNATTTRHVGRLFPDTIKTITDDNLTVDLEIPNNNNRVGISFWMPDEEIHVDKGGTDSSYNADPDAFAYLFLLDKTTTESYIAGGTSPAKRRWMKLVAGSYFEPPIAPTDVISIVLFSSQLSKSTGITVIEYNKI